MAKSKARYLADVLQGDGSLVFSGDLSVPTTFTIDPLPSGAGGSVTIGGDLVSTGGLGNASLENSSITINSYSTALGGTVTLVTDDVLEGGSPTNLYYTDTRVRAAISLTDTGGDGSLAYDSGTGAFTFAGPSAAETRAHFTAGTGVSITTGEIAIGQPVATTDAVTFSSVTGTGSSNFDTLTVSTSASIPYDNTISGLTATTVQSAISEINNLLGGGNIGSQASFDIHEFIATAAQVTFDLDTIGTSPHPSYIAGYIQVFLNGVLLSSNGDYIATDGQNIVLSSGADVGDILSVVILDSFDIANQLRVLSLDASAATNSLTIDSSSNVGIGTTAPDALLHVSATSPHIDIGPQGGNRGKIGYHSNDVIIGSTSSTGNIIFKNNISSTDSPQTSGDVKMTISDVGLTIHSDTYNILNLQTDSNNDQTSTDGIIKITNNDGSSDVTKAEFRWDESEDLVHVSYGDHGRHVSINSTGKVGIGTGSTSPTATLEVAGTALVENAKLKAIAASNSDTAVDVFVYDTSKDSDGGAWRKRTQHTSWYNETLNTSTRGARKEFPSVAVIVAESDTVTIYDGDDPDMPMWMVWEQAGVLSWASETTTTSISITALNGKFVWGTDDRGSGIADFIKDDIEIFHGPTEYVLKDKKISSRSTSSFTTGEGYSIVHPDVKDVAMTVLPNAPIDADTGLPVPTIAVATDGGVSVIKDDGTVISQGVGASIGYIPSNIDFVGTGQIIVGRDTYGNGNRHSHLIDIDNLSSTTNANAAADFVDISSYTGASNQVLPVGNMSGTGVLGLSSEEMAYVHGNPGPLYKFINNGSTASKGSVAKITSDYNTGWMHGDIKLATLSDTDATNVTGSELVTNGTFDSDVVGWTAITSTIAYSSGTMQITRSGGSGYTAYQAISTQVGATYILTATINSSGSTGSVYINNAVSSDPAANVQGTNGQTVDVSLQFVAESTTSYVQFAVDSDGTSISVDNVSVRLAEPDRSVNGNGLQVYGTVTKTAVATGAELVGYSGFSSSNYLQQPYNADLNFGTGSYSIMGWFKTDATNSTGIIAQLGPSDADEILMVYIAPSNYGIYFDYGAGGEYSHLSSANDRALIANTEWHHFVCHISAGGRPKIYVDGIDKTLTVSANAPSTFSFDTDYVLNIGNGRGTDANLPFGGSIALLRISATVPSPEQIKKIYSDEKHLFQENAKATLYGSSDAVTALAYDDDTELLHVGTSAGRSVFQGLRRVNNTTDAVSAAISASNGFIVED